MDGREGTGGTGATGAAAPRTATGPKDIDMPTTKTTRAPKAPKGQPVTLRRLARDFGEGKKGTIALILNPKVFGSTGENWLGGKTYATRDLAIAAAKAAGAVVQNPPKAA